MTKGEDEKVKLQARVHKSLRVWSMYADLEESFGTVNLWPPTFILASKLDRIA